MRSLPRRLTRPAPAASPPRGGTTLTEVLMSLLVMGVGVVTVATLFPIAILRSIQATQITGSTILRLNAETMIAVNPDFVFDPNLSGNRAAFHGENYLVDPLGRALGYGNLTLGTSQLNRYHGGFTTMNAANSFVALPDSWTLQIEDVADASVPFDPNAVTLSNTGLDLSQIPIYEDANGNGTLDPGEDLNGNGALDVVRSRCILFGADGRSSQTRNIASIVGRTIGWGTPLPGSFEIGMVKIETQDIRYSYMLTVRNTGVITETPPDRAQVDVVVFFNRGGSDSNLHETTVWSLANPADSNTRYTITWSGVAPFLRKGSYLLDIDAARWYRIQKVVEGGNSAEITIEGYHATPVRNAVFIPGVVDVYPLGLKTGAL